MFTGIVAAVGKISSVTPLVGGTFAGVRLDEREDGHGFGLAIARELAALYGGVLVLDDAPGGGLSASVTLPIGTAV